MSTRHLRLAAFAPLFALALAVYACNGGGGPGGGGGGDDDDDGTPTPPDRPGWVVLRLQETLSIAEADGDPSLVDVTAAPGGHKTLVGFSGDDVIYCVGATNTTEGDLYAVAPDGTGNRLLATGVSTTGGGAPSCVVYGWADPTHLLVQKGLGPDQQFPPDRDIYVVPVDGTGEIALAAVADVDDVFGGMHGSTVVFRRGPLTGEADLYSVPALGGAESQLTSAAGAEVFAFFTASGRVVFTGNSPDTKVFAVDQSVVDLAPSLNSPVLPALVIGERIILQEVVPLNGAVDGNVYAVDSDGSNFTPIANVPDFPENALAITAGGRVLVSHQTEFDPIVIDLLSIPAGGGEPVRLGDLSSGGIAAIDGETIVLENGTPGQLTAIESDGTNERVLASGAGGAVFRAKTSTRVIYGSDDEGAEKLWSVPIAGGNATQLRPGTSGADDFAAVLANIVVIGIGGDGGLGDIVAVDSGGGNLRVLADAPEAEVFRAITPDGRVIFTRKTAFLEDIFIVGSDGENEVSLTDRADADIYLGFLP